MLRLYNMKNYPILRKKQNVKLYVNMNIKMLNTKTVQHKRW